MLFTLVMYWRIIYGVLRVIAGILLLQVVGTPLTELFPTGFEHTSGPATIAPLMHGVYTFLIGHGLMVTYFLAFYCIFWGAVDIVVTVALLKHHLWAFPTSIILIALFLIYEIYRVAHTHSPILFTFIIIDTGVLYLIYREYERLRKYHLFAEELEAAERAQTTL